MRNPRTNLAASTTSQRTRPRTVSRKRPRTSPISLRLSLLGVRHGLRFRKRKTRTPPSKIKLSFPTNLERSHDARDHCWHALHDLEANQFFVSLVSRSRQLANEGLLLWHGEEQVRAERREKAREYKWPTPTPDGCGVYLAERGRILFDLEWDRATESMGRMRQKIASYVGYFEHFRNAEQHHVLFVVPTDDREDKLQYTIWQGRPHFGSDSCCSFWTTTSDRLRWWGPLGVIWLKVENRAAEPPPLSVTRLGRRIPLKRLPPMQPNERAIADCIGKPAWWERRPGGGQVA